MIVTAANFKEVLQGARAILGFADDTHEMVLRIYDLVQTNEDFFHVSPGGDKLEAAVLKLETLVDEFNRGGATPASKGELMKELNQVINEIEQLEQEEHHVCSYATGCCNGCCGSLRHRC